MTRAVQHVDARHKGGHDGSAGLRGTLSPPAPGLSLVKLPSPHYISGMSFPASLVPIAVGAVAIVLVLGLVNMLRGGSASTSQNLMRLRVVLQFIAILVIVGVLWWRGG